MLNRKRAMPLKPTPPPFRNHGNYVVSVAELNRWLGEKAEEAGAYVLSETVGAQAAGRGRRGRRRPHGRQGPRQAGRREVELRAGLRRRRAGDRARRGLLGPPDRRGAQGPRPRGHRPAGVGARRQGGLGGRAAARDRVIHTLGWPLRPQAKYKEFGGSWIYPMNREGEPPQVSLGFVVGLDYADARLSVHDVLQEFKLHPLVRQDPRRRQARRLGREGDPRGRLLGDAAAARARHGHLRRRRRHGQRAEAQGHPLRDPLGHARGRDDLPRSSRPARATSRPTSGAVHDSEIGKDLYESRNMKQPFAQGPDRRRRDHQRDGRHQGAAARRATGRRTATPTSR